MDSKQDGFFECDLKNCMSENRGKCCNPCYVDCPYFKLKQSLRDLLTKYEHVKENIWN